MDYKKVLAGYTAAEKKKGLEDYTQYNSYYRSLQDRFRSAGIKKIFKNLDAYIKTADQIRRDECRHMVGAMRVNPKWDCIAFCQLSDASGEIFGATDLWRNPKAIFKGLTEAEIPVPYIVPFADPRVLTKGSTFNLDVNVVNEHTAGIRYTAVIEIVKPGQRPVARFSVPFTSRSWVDEVFKKKLTVDFAPGRYQVRTILKKGSKTVAGNRMALSVIPEPVKGTPKVTLFDLDGRLAPAFSYLGYDTIKGSNNHQSKAEVMMFSMDQHAHPGLMREILGQVRRLVQTGGTAILLEPPTPLLYDNLLPRIVRQAYTQRDLLYVHDHPVFRGLPKKCLMDFDYDAVRPRATNNPDDVRKLGGSIICGSISSHMWTGPDIYYWGSALDIIPLGRGNVVTCQLNLLKNVKTSPVARLLITNLVNYGSTLIRPGYEEKLLTRCIDPIKL